MRWIEDNEFCHDRKITEKNIDLDSNQLMQKPLNMNFFFLLSFIISHET